MLKKIICFLSVFFVMLVSCTGPIFSKNTAHAESVQGVFLSVQSTPDYADIQSNQLYYIFFNKGDYTFLYKCNETALNNLNYVYANGRLNITGAVTFTQYVSAQSSYSLQLLGCELHTDTLEAIGYDLNGNTCLFDAFNQDNSTISDLDTNFPNVILQRLNLDISFNPVLSGTVSRTNTINGKEYTSTSLDMCISNYGENAQFAWFIVPHGGSLTFPQNMLDNSAGYYGSPTYAYVTDEWTKCTVGLLGSSVYAPSVWHAIPSNYINQYYHVAWSQMNLQKGVSYDCVVYACVNENTSNTSDIGSQYTINAVLSDIQEVYRSTFSMDNPAEYVENSDAFGVHSWNPDVDNSGMFDVSSGYKDENGNVIIKGQTRNNSAAHNITSAAWGDSDYSISSLFGTYFQFLNGVYSFFPYQWQAIITVGLISLVVLGILKAVS